MNLRHIDPGSTDWMDAMLDGDDDRPVAGRRRTPTSGMQVPKTEAMAQTAAPQPPAHTGDAPPSISARGPTLR
jgi:hypothetical protein